MVWILGENTCNIALRWEGGGGGVCKNMISSRVYCVPRLIVLVMHETAVDNRNILSTDSIALVDQNSCLSRKKSESCLSSVNIGHVRLVESATIDPNLNS